MDGVSYRYRTGAAIQGVSVEVAAGELFGIVGPNSAGKSTLLRLLSKVLAPDRGTIQVLGRDLAALSRVSLARSLAVVPQDFQVAFPFTVRDVVLMGRYPHAGGGVWGGPRDVTVAEAAMEAAEVAGLADRRMDELSGGERQLVSVARALAQEPAVLLLDEPTAHLDLKHQALVLEILLGRPGATRRTSVLVSHDLNLAAEHCDRVLLLAAGAVQAVGTPEEVITPQHLTAAYGCAVSVERDPVSSRPRVRSEVRRPGSEVPKGRLPVRGSREA
jgi:iron complex transport system ATP-binding protein